MYKKVIHKKNELSKETLLFTKPGCQKCQYIKEQCDLTGVEVIELNPNMDSIEEQIKSATALSKLAWFEGVNIAEKELPILVLPSGDKFVGAINIKKRLLKKQQEQELGRQRI
jgi:glutaredoxin